MTANPYVAIHHSKGLALRKCFRPFLQSLIKGIPHNLHFKSAAFTEQSVPNVQSVSNNIGSDIHSVS